MKNVQLAISAVVFACTLTIMLIPPLPAQVPVVEHDKGAWQGHVYHGWAVTGAARLLMKQGKPDQALALLDSYAPLSRSMGFRALAGFGDLYAELGRKDRALDKYRESIEANNRYESFNEAVRTKIEAL